MNSNKTTLWETKLTHMGREPHQLPPAAISPSSQNYALFDGIRALPNSDNHAVVLRLAKYYCGKNVAKHFVISISKMIANRRTDEEIMVLLRTTKKSSHNLKRSSKIGKSWRTRPKHYHQLHAPPKNALEERLHHACCGGRATSRVHDIAHILHKITNPNPYYVDIGCGNGEITTAIAAAICSTPNHTIGCDTENKISSGRTLKYIQSTGTSIQGVKCGSANLITIMMAAHHFMDLPAMLGEVKRIAAPGAIIIMREHNATTESGKWFYDFTHAAYECMMPGSTKKIGEFMDTFAAFYKSANEWVELMGDHGFTLITEPFLPNIGGRPVHDKVDSIYMAFTPTSA